MSAIMTTQFGPAISTPSFAEQFFNLAGNFLGSQADILKRQNDTVANADLTSKAFTIGAISNANSYAYGLFFQQSQFLNSLGQSYANVANQAIGKMSGGGLFSSLF